MKKRAACILASRFLVSGLGLRLNALRLTLSSQL